MKRACYLVPHAWMRFVASSKIVIEYIEDEVAPKAIITVPMRPKFSLIGCFLIAGRVNTNPNVAIEKRPKTVITKLTKFEGSSRKLNPYWICECGYGTMTPAHNME